MSARRKIFGLLVLSALLLGALPAAAEASPTAPQLLSGVSRLDGELALMGQAASEPGSPGRRVVSELRFKNSDGYSISVLAFGQTVALSVSRAHVRPHRPGDGNRKRRDRLATTTYLAHGKVTPTSIAASFGERGRISVRFEPSSRAVRGTRRAGCRQSNGGVLANFGFFVGELHFEGEGGYTSADVHRAHGRSVDLSAVLACLLSGGVGGRAAIPASSAPLGLRLPGVVGDHLGAPSTPAVATHPSTGPKPTTLLASSKVALARTVFAAQVKGKGRPRFLAAEELSEGSIGILRLVSARGAPSAFSTDPSLSSADVSPPPPFAGSGSLRHGPANAKAWTGSLTVSFLGAPNVPLVGPPFNARLARGF